MPCDIFENLQLWFTILSRILFTLKYKRFYVVLAYDLRCGSIRPGNRRRNLRVAWVRLIGWGFPVLMKALGYIYILCIRSPGLPIKQKALIQMSISVQLNHNWPTRPQPHSPCMYKFPIYSAETIA
jgi:hypothetical protein